VAWAIAGVAGALPADLHGIVIEITEQELPPELRNAYGDAVRAREWSSRHKGLLDFAESSLGYLASLCLSDYRTRCVELAGNVESLIERSPELAWLAIKTPEAASSE
jgi:kynureninase